MSTMHPAFEAGQCSFVYMKDSPPTCLRQPAKLIFQVTAPFAEQSVWRMISHVVAAAVGVRAKTASRSTGS